MLTLTASPTVLHQSGVIPFTVTRHGLRVLLVTNSGGDRWLVPKGHVEPDLGVVESARMEAFEEAGALGVVGTAPLGSFRYAKRDQARRVELFPMRVTRLLPRWDEMHRRRLWLSPDAAGRRVFHDGLGAIIAALPERLSNRLHERCAA